MEEEIKPAAGAGEAPQTIDVPNSWNWNATKSEFDAASSYNTATSDRARVDYSSDYKRNLNYDLSSNKMNVTKGTPSQPPYSSPNLSNPGWNGTGTPGSWNGGYPDSGSVKVEGYDIVGIKASEIDNMTASIKKYVDNVQNTLSSCLETNDQKLNEAIRGSQLEAAVNAYINKVKLYCQNITSDLLAFSDKLIDVGNQWIEHTKSMAASIDAGTSSYAAGTAYQTSAVYQGNK